MSELAGIATVQGVNGSVSYAAIVSGGALQPDGSVTIADDANITEIMDAHGDRVGGHYTNKKRSITLEMIAVDAAARPGTIANAKKALALPSIPSTVTLSGFDESATNDINGTYLYEGGGQISESTTGVAKLTIPVKRFSHIGAASLATVAS